MFMIATKPSRRVRKTKNAVQKFALVTSSGKFKWVTDPNQATLFKTFSDLLFAYASRCAELDGDPTKDVTVAEASQSGVSVSRVYNGH